MGQDNADSTPNCNAVGFAGFAEEYFVWGFHVEALAWAGVQALHDVRQLGVGHRGEVGALRQILAHQAVGVLIRAALP